MLHHKPRRWRQCNQLLQRRFLLPIAYVYLG